jgi:hypothetical protein
MNVRMILLGVAAVVVSMGYQWSAASDPPPPAPADTLEIADLRVTSDAALRRDPGTAVAWSCSGGGSGLSGIVVIHPQAGAIPTEAKPGRVWVQFPGGTWTGRLEETGRPNGTLRTRFARGPEVAENASCDVIVELIVPGSGSGFVRTRATVSFTN